MSVSSDTSGLHLPQPTTGPSSSVDHGANLPQSTGVSGDQSMQQFHAAGPAQQQPSLIGHPQQAMVQNDQTDELDKEWINKAKLIVEQTKNDPFTQSKEIGRAKADYLRIRFNKHVKLGPDQTV